MTFKELIHLSPMLNLSALSRHIGRERMYLTQVVAGRIKFSKKLGDKLESTLFTIRQKE